MATTQAKQALRKYRREHKLCIHCGNPAQEARTMCIGCAERARAAQQRAASRNAARGLCRNAGCHNKPTGRNHYCDTCNARSTRNGKRREMQRIAMGLCRDCGKQPCWEHRTRCQACTERLNAAGAALSARRNAAGKCSKCGDYVLVPGYRQCQACIDQGRKRHAARKLEVLAAYGGPVCIGCGESEVVVLQVDHIAGGGYKHSQQIGGTGKLYKWLQDNGFPPGFRVLCANCNVRAARGIPFPNEA